MDAGRDTFSQRRAVERDVYALLIHRMAGLVQRREYCVANVVLVDASGDAHVASRKAPTEWMMRKVKPSTANVPCGVGGQPTAPKSNKCLNSGGPMRARRQDFLPRLDLGHCW